MNPDLLLQHCDRLVEAPDAIPRLRRFILDLAVRGKLVEQGPAGELIKRIRKEKGRLVQAGNFPRQRPLPAIGTRDDPLRLPVGWAWVTLGEMSDLVTSGSRDWAKYYADSGAQCVRMGNLFRDSYRLRLDHIQYVQPPREGEGARTSLDPGDILLSITGEVGLPGLVPGGFGEAHINQHTCLVRPSRILNNRYLQEFFRSPLAQNQFNGPQRGIKNSFRLTDVTQFVISSPPRRTTPHRRQSP